MAVVSEGGATHTIKLCRKCYTVRRVKQGEAEESGVKWRALVEQKSSQGKLWAAFGVDKFLRKVWEHARDLWESCLYPEFPPVDDPT